MNDEPVVNAASVAIAIDLFIAWIAAMGWLSWSEAQHETFRGFMNAMIPFALLGINHAAAAWYARQRVYPKTKVDAMVQENARLRGAVRDMR